MQTSILMRRLRAANRSPSWLPSGAAFMADFAGDRAYIGGTTYGSIASLIAAGQLDFARASVKDAEIDAIGTLQEFAINELAVPVYVSGDGPGAYLQPADAPRAADLLTRDITGQGFGTQGTVLIRGRLLDNGGQAFPRIWQIDTDAETDRICIFYNTASTRLECIVRSGDAQQAAWFKAYVIGDEFSIALAWAENSVIVSFGGSVETEDTSAIMPSGLTTERWAKGTVSASACAVLLTEYTHWNSRLSNAEVQALAAA